MTVLLYYVGLLFVSVAVAALNNEIALGVFVAGLGILLHVIVRAVITLR